MVGYGTASLADSPEQADRVAGKVLVQRLGRVVAF